MLKKAFEITTFINYYIRDVIGCQVVLDKCLA